MVEKKSKPKSKPKVVKIPENKPVTNSFWDE